MFSLVQGLSDSAIRFSASPQPAACLDIKLSSNTHSLLSTVVPARVTTFEVVPPVIEQ